MSEAKGPYDCRQCGVNIPAPDLNVLCVACRNAMVAAKVHEHTDAAWQLGHELMQPMPPDWGRSMYEITRPRGTAWEVVMTHKDQWRMPDDKKADYTARSPYAPLTEAHRLCREQAWAKHRKNTEGA